MNKKYWEWVICSIAAALAAVSAILQNIDLATFFLVASVWWKPRD